jgi:hypothetical protein
MGSTVTDVQMPRVDITISGPSPDHAKECMVAAAVAGGAAQPIGLPHNSDVQVDVHVSWTFRSGERATERLAAMAEFVRRTEG